ncbi:MAG: lytic murein transglycosylase [Balneolaceae bacterium]|nr:lytic murein transglycosylase [Balneolaceae bacterium]
MDSRLLSLKKTIACCTLLIFSISGLAVAQPNAEKYKEPLAALSSWFNGHDVNFAPLLDDQRFEIYHEIGDKFRKSAERKSVDIDRYKIILGFEQKRAQIREFMNTHAEELAKAEAEYDIPKYVISAIIGIESDFGQNFGDYNPFNVYVSMYAVGYRQDFARAQLKELLEFTERKNMDVFELKSSYAGAMSAAQFIPYSVNKWWVGEDLWDMTNNIHSVANYLAYFKKRTGSLEKAVLRYNPSSLYTRAVLDLAKEAEERISAGQ